MPSPFHSRNELDFESLAYRRRLCARWRLAFSIRLARAMSAKTRLNFRRRSNTSAIGPSSLREAKIRRARKDLPALAAGPGAGATLAAGTLSASGWVMAALGTIASPGTLAFSCYALRIVAAWGTSTVIVSKSLFFANERFGALADGASKPREVRAIFPGFVKHDLHRPPASRAVLRSLVSQRIKQKVQVGFHGAVPVAARFITAEAPEGCLTARRGQQLLNLCLSNARAS